VVERMLSVARCCGAARRDGAVDVDEVEWTPASCALSPGIRAELEDEENAVGLPETVDEEAGEEGCNLLWPLVDPLSVDVSAPPYPEA
jgi:hypothetical protein